MDYILNEMEKLNNYIKKYYAQQAFGKIANFVVISHYYALYFSIHNKYQQSKGLSTGVIFVP